MHADFAALFLSKLNHQAILEHEYYAIVIRECRENPPPHCILVNQNVTASSEC
jgi:hypothetical protein